MPELSLHSAVMQALADNPLVHADEISAEIDGRTVILRGTVGSMIHHAEAGRIAGGVPGVERVENHLRFRPMDSSGRADADTEAAVRDALAADDDLHAADIDVRVHDGAVTLQGMVELGHQRERAERIAMAVPGVTAVQNELTVWFAVSAADIAERVTDAIGVDAQVGRDRISVAVRNNAVTLTGVVTSEGHREAAVVAAAQTPGVLTVHDELSVGQR
jgi:osmotically-inducible protein OsmY